MLLNSVLNHSPFVLWKHQQPDSFWRCLNRASWTTVTHCYTVRCVRKSDAEGPACTECCGITSHWSQMTWLSCQCLHYLSFDHLNWCSYLLILVWPGASSTWMKHNWFQNVLCVGSSLSLSLSPFMTGFLPPFHCRWFYIEFITVSWMLLNRDSDVDLRSWAKWPWNVHLSLGSACVSRRVSEFVVLWMVFFGICSVSYLMSALCTCLRIVVQVSYIAGFIDKSRWFKVLSDQRFVCILCPASLHCVIVDYSLSSCIFPNL